MTLTDAPETRHEKILTALREKADRWTRSGRADVFTVMCRPLNPATTSTLARTVAQETAITLLDEWNKKCSVPGNGIVQMQRDFGVDAAGTSYEDGQTLVIYVMDQHGDEYLVTRTPGSQIDARCGTNLLAAAGLPADELTDRVAELVWRLAGPLPTSDAAIRAMWPEPGTTNLDDDAITDRYAISESVDRHVRLLMLASLDGVAAVDGISAPLSSPGDKRMYNLLSAQADLILLGASTVRAEQYGHAILSPLVIAQRIARGQQPYPTVAIVSRSLQLDPGGPLFQPVNAHHHHMPPRPLLLAPAAAVAKRDPRLADRAELVTTGDTDVDLAAAVDALVERGHRRIVCHGGPDLAAQMVREDLVDELCLTIAPLMLAASGPRITAGYGEPIAARWRIHQSYIDEQGDIFLRYRAKWRQR